MEKKDHKLQADNLILNQHAVSDITYALYNDLIDNDYYFLETVRKSLLNLKNGFGNNGTIKYIADRLKPVTLGVDKGKINLYSATILSTSIKSDKNFVEVQFNIDDYHYTMNMSKKEVADHLIKASLKSLMRGIEYIFTTNLQNQVNVIANIIPDFENISGLLVKTINEWKKKWAELYPNFIMHAPIITTPDLISAKIILAGETYLKLMGTKDFFCTANSVLYNNLAYSMNFVFGSQASNIGTISNTKFYSSPHYEPQNKLITSTCGIVGEVFKGAVSDNLLDVHFNHKLPAGDNFPAEYIVRWDVGTIITTNLYISPQIIDNEPAEDITKGVFPPLNLVVAEGAYFTTKKSTSHTMTLTVYKPEGISPKDVISIRSGKAYRYSSWEDVFTHTESSIFISSLYTKNGLEESGAKPVYDAKGYYTSYMHYAEGAIQAKYLVPYLPQMLKEKEKHHNVPFVIEEQTTDIETLERRFKFRGGAAFCVDPRYMCRIPIFWG